jgi:hypothetical protein
MGENLIEGVFHTSGAIGSFAGLAQDCQYVEPKGVAGNVLGLGMLSAGAKIDPRPMGAVGVAGAVVPTPAGKVDSAATYRGAFEPGATVPWTGFTSLSQGGILVP